MNRGLQLIALQDFPLVQPGDDLAALIRDSLRHNQLELIEGDVLVVAQKVVSKAENRYVDLGDIEPSERALTLAGQAGKDPRQVECILREAREVLRVRPGVIIVEHRNGYVMANAGIDKSNIEQNSESPRLLLLPEDADRSAEALRKALTDSPGCAPMVIVNDSVGRAWRNGTVGMAIGSAGLEPLYNQIGERDLFGNVLEVTEAAVADELAAAASLVQGQADEASPVVLARGARLRPGLGGARALLRDRAMDMFR
ncbi:coenzyme F420-0:L-glutamate ligase [Parahaliea mediterranea]|uniref:Coenzyme F420-0:L-glutamate ligase n=1 Tax=Parahaliea mediterranea TaxID=651086 RepID=A0A939IL54_9GAMM|nr:coenzyme F420-0:L-glutamate ligase [Parahaliea mediterranea]MBN7798031.1 coenzyme F420-0:L-glutamate ligase [Parahaliea mediterranea]